MYARARDVFLSNHDDNDDDMKSYMLVVLGGCAVDLRRATCDERPPDGTHAWKGRRAARFRTVGTRDLCLAFA